MTVNHTSYWTSWQPTLAEPWDLRRVVHLHRRAGFAGTWDELQRDLRDGPEATVDRVLAGRASTTGVPDDFEEKSQVLAEAAVSARRPERLKAWWLYRMLFTPDPLTERLALMWHNHFATSIRKVDDVGLMHGQNALFREFARGPFRELLVRIVKQPALLLWLDADANLRQHPNENLARELMELFTLGVGHYTESDVRECARALTGWTVVNGQFRDMSDDHDDGEKVLLGRAGPLGGDDILEILLAHPATARRIAGRLCGLLLGENVVDEAGVHELADGLHRNNLDVGWGVETILRSHVFFSEANIGARILGPAEYIVGSIRALELFDPPPSTLVLAEWMAALGQDLFNPPNVFGWDGGRAWINGRSVIARANFAAALAQGRLRHPDAPPDLLRLAERHASAGTVEQAVAFFASLLSASAPTAEIQDAVGAEVNLSSSLTPDSARRVVSILLSLPATQLG
jgi:uncharacterized protein (DUF1800 family)